MRHLLLAGIVGCLLAGCSNPFEEESAQFGGREDVVGIDPDDEDLAQAVADARASFPKFLELWKKRKEDDHFGVKFKFTAGDKAEHMWVLVTSVNGTRIKGYLDNEPATLTHMEEGDKVNLKTDQIDDWYVMQDGTIHGYYSLKVMEKYGGAGFAP